MEKEQENKIMEPFPQEHELMELFESEPTKLDEEVPFFYNNNTYKLCRPNGELYFEIEPSHRWSRVVWKQGTASLVDLTLENIKGIDIEKRSGMEFMNFYFDEEQGVRTLLLKTKPAISVIWGTLSD
ncbi:hypothetical protein M3625_07325 [Paenibacillus sp. MER 78]|nr:hypothetical protein [Paenibacillus sp. MER 78]